jgi:hypothetical protein
MAKHVCPNSYHGDGARGGCFFEIRASETEERAELDVGHSCVVVHRGEIPVTWLAELVAIATLHKGGIAGFLAEHGYGGPDNGSYALMCDPAEAA